MISKKDATLLSVPTTYLSPCISTPVFVLLSQCTLTCLTDDRTEGIELKRRLITAKDPVKL